jgi:hypothetical protein
MYRTAAANLGPWEGAARSRKRRKWRRLGGTPSATAASRASVSRMWRRAAGSKRREEGCDCVPSVIQTMTGGDAALRAGGDQAAAAEGFVVRMGGENERGSATRDGLKVGNREGLEAGRGFGRGHAHTRRPCFTDSCAE